jgi:hypothetical protein
MVALTLFGAIRQTLGRSLRNGFFGLLIGGGLVEGLATLINKGDVTLQTLSVNTSAPTLFVHVVAVLLAITMGSLFTVWTVASRTVQGIAKGADNAVDAVDGPKRHGLF